MTMENKSIKVVFDHVPGGIHQERKVLNLNIILLLLCTVVNLPNVNYLSIKKSLFTPLDNSQFIQKSLLKCHFLERLYFFIFES